MTAGRFSNTQYNISYPFNGSNPSYSNFQLNLTNTTPVYFSSTNNGNLTSQSFSYNVGTPNKDKGAASRYIEFRVKASKNLESSISSIDIHPDSGSHSDPGCSRNKKYKKMVQPTVGSWDPSLNSSGSFTDVDGNKVFIANSWLGNGFGGSATINIHLKRAKFIDNNSTISTYSASNTLNPILSSYITAYHPVYEALRIFRAPQLNPNNDYNKQVLEDEMKDPYIKEIIDHYNSLVNQIPNKFPKPKYGQEEIDNYIKQLQDIRDKGINDIKSAAKKWRIPAIMMILYLTILKRQQAILLKIWIKLI